MTDLELARRLSAGRTKGPWRTYDIYPKDYGEVFGPAPTTLGDRITLGSSADAAFIAYFGTHADSLLDELEALRRIAEEAEIEHSGKSRELECPLCDAVLAWRSLKTEGEGRP